MAGASGQVISISSQGWADEGGNFPTSHRPPVFRKWSVTDNKTGVRCMMLLLPGHLSAGDVLAIAFGAFENLILFRDVKENN